MMKRTETYALFVRFESDPKGSIPVAGNDVLEAHKLFSLGLVTFVQPKDDDSPASVKLSKKGRATFDAFFKLGAGNPEGE